MHNPFKFVNDCFKDEFQVRFSIERLDGSVTLSLHEAGVTVAQRMLSGEQLADPAKLRHRIQSIRFGLAIDRGQGMRCLAKISRAAANEA
ncbi:MAG: DUF3509 domain-containing protein [Pseudomonas sp.]|uniref:DUF3509 domain-containing protein n=1 Tax=Pseudomonas sp. TaxID=306 RepID=UPI00339311C8